jgi:TPR repeat protein
VAILWCPGVGAAENPDRPSPAPPRAAATDAPQPASPDELFRKGLAARDREDKTRALELYRQAARAGHGNARQALDRLGRIN